MFLHLIEICGKERNNRRKLTILTSQSEGSFKKIIGVRRKPKSDYCCSEMNPELEKKCCAQMYPTFGGLNTDAGIS
jgi:hypothetical protein